MFASGWKKCVSLLWIDGDHSYQGVKRDFGCWSPHLSKDAFIAFDDATDTNLGPRKLIGELISSGKFEEVFAIGKIAVIRKCIAETVIKVMMRFDLKIKDEKLLNYLRWNSYLSTRFKLLYIATPKVACTSLKWWFAALEDYSKALLSATGSSESSPDLVIHDVFHKIAPNVTGLLPEALAEPLIVR